MHPQDLQVPLLASKIFTTTSCFNTPVVVPPGLWQRSLPFSLGEPLAGQQGCQCEKEERCCFHTERYRQAAFFAPKMNADKISYQDNRALGAVSVSFSGINDALPDCCCICDSILAGHFSLLV